MKFMKLGSKPDAFQQDGTNVRFVASDLPTDIIVIVGEVKFYLHKFPLLSKSSLLQRLVFRANEDNKDKICIDDFPGGPKAFEICAKFCYGMTFTLNAYNVVPSRCAAEYLEMTEDIDKGNLIYKIDVFLNSSVFRSWRDSIIALQTTMTLLPWSEDLKIVGKCIDYIASMTSVDPCLINWSYTCNKREAATDRVIEAYKEKTCAVPKDWWVEDICELDVDLYKRVMDAIKSKGRMSSDLIGEALKTYAVRWLPDSYDALVSDHHTRRNRSLVETLIHLLPSNKSSGCSCRFLFKILKVVILVEAGDLLKEELLKRISAQLHKASVKDLLIPTKARGGSTYDVDLVCSLVIRFMMEHRGSVDSDYNRSENMMGDLLLAQESLPSLGKLIDGYLAEISSDLNLPLPSFISLSELLPKAARPIHDGLYKAIDIYLKEHPSLVKGEKKQICSLMDVKKLSSDASMHAAQNERLPLRIVVQILFFEQMRAAAAAARRNELLHGSTNCTANIDEDLRRPSQEHYSSIGRQLKSVKIEDRAIKSSKSRGGGGGLLLSSRSRRIFDKLWAVRGQAENNRSSETSKSPGSSSRNRRHSVS